MFVLHNRLLKNTERIGENKYVTKTLILSELRNFKFTNISGHTNALHFSQGFFLPTSLTQFVQCYNMVLHYIP